MSRDRELFKTQISNTLLRNLNLFTWVRSIHKAYVLQRHRFPVAYKRFAKVPNLRVWQGSTFAFLDSVADKIEKKFGRLRPLVATTRPWNETAPKIKAQVMKLVDDGPHFR